MEESISLLKRIKKSFGIEEVDIKAYSPLTLAYIGDGVFDLVIRTVVVERGNRPANKLHHKTISLVKAQTQSAMAEVLLPDLRTEELAVYKRGRNAKPYTSAKNASISDYRKATGLEAVMGYLYLTDGEARMVELIYLGLERLNMML